MFIFLAGNIGTNVIWQTIKLIAIFLLILLLAYYATKFVARFHNNSLNGKTNLRIMESMSLGNNKFLAVVEINGVYYALGIGKDEITFIDKLSDYTPPNGDIVGTADNPKRSFKDVLAQFKTKSESQNKDQDMK